MSSAAQQVSEETSVRLLAARAGARATGILTVTSRKLKRLFCLERGRLIYAASNMIEEQFDEVLVREGLLSPGHRASAKLEASKKGIKLIAYLHQEKVVPPSTLIQSLEQHVRKMLLSSLVDAHGEPVFSDGRPSLDGELLVDLSCVPIVLEHVRSHPESPDEVRVRIGPPNVKPKRGSSAKHLLEDVDLEAAARFVVESCDGTRDVPKLLAESPVEEDLALRALYGLALLGIVDTFAESRLRAGSKHLEVTRTEALGRIRSAEAADCYTILGVGKTAEAQEIRDSYYYLARRYHPDRFRTGPLKDIFDLMEQYFVKVTEAYNTLIEPDLRSAYDEELAKIGGKKKVEPQADASHLARQNFMRAKVLLGKKRFHDALTFLENAVQLNPSDANYQLELGQVLALNPRRRADAERHLLLATELNPASPHGYFALGELYVRLDRVQDAGRMFKEVLRWEPKHAEARDRLAQIAGTGRRRGGLFKG